MCLFKYLQQVLSLSFSLSYALSLSFSLSLSLYIYIYFFFFDILCTDHICEFHGDFILVQFIDFLCSQLNQILLN